MEQPSPFAKLTIERIRCVADKEGDNAALDHVASIFVQMAALLVHLGGRNRLTQEIGTLCKIFDIGDDEDPRRAA